MTERCADPIDIEILDEHQTLYCTLPIGHLEAHRAVMWWDNVKVADHGRR